MLVLGFYGKNALRQLMEHYMHCNSLDSADGITGVYKFCPGHQPERKDILDALKTSDLSSQDWKTFLKTFKTCPHPLKGQKVIPRFQMCVKKEIGKGHSFW